jgi:plasmid stabilization system protein ParE
MAFRLQPAADRDIDDILSWYRDVADAAVARMMRDGFHDTFRRIGRLPVMGLRRIELLPDPYRFTLFDPYWIVWIPVTKRSVAIVRVIHARRDMARLLEGLR